MWQDDEGKIRFHGKGCCTAPKWKRWVVMVLAVMWGEGGQESRDRSASCPNGMGEGPSEGKDGTTLAGVKSGEPTVCVGPGQQRSQQIRVSGYDVTQQSLNSEHNTGKGTDACSTKVEAEALAG
eukprot:EG_transcript_28999